MKNEIIVAMTLDRGGANFIKHTNGFRATCIIEVYETNGDIRTIEE